MTEAPTSGAWKVHTEASSYLFDFDEMTFIRTCGDGLGTDRAVNITADPLRGDDEKLAFCGVSGWGVGESLSIRYKPYPDNRSYELVRRTTLVCDITAYRPMESL